MTKGSDLLVAALENEGVDRIFALPGEENLDVLESLRNSKIELVLTRHEQAAAFMAATQGGLPAVPGLPVDVRAGRAEFHHGCGLRPSRRDADAHDHRTEGDHERAAGALSDRGYRRGDAPADQDDAADRVGRHDPDHRARCVPRRGGRAARAGASRTAGGHRGRDRRTPCARSRPHPIERPVASAAAIERAAAMILEAKRPLIMFGAAGNRPRLVEALSDFVRRTGIPFFNTQMGKGAVDRRLQSLSRHRCALGTRLRS